MKVDVGPYSGTEVGYGERRRPVGGSHILGYRNAKYKKELIFLIMFYVRDRI